MGLFSSDSSFDFEKIPSTREQDQARAYLSNLYQDKLRFPEQQIAGLTDTQRQAQDQVKDYLTSSQEDYGQARDYFSDVLNDEYDPSTSQYYSGIRDQLDFQKGEAQAGVRRTAQKAGSARSTPFLGAESKTGQLYDFQKDKVLGELTERERTRKAGAAVGIQEAGSRNIANIGAANRIADEERQIQQMKFQAAQERLIQDMLAPYNYNAKVATAVLNEVRYQGVQSGGGLTDLGFAATLGGSFAGNYWQGAGA